MSKISTEAMVEYLKERIAELELYAGHYRTILAFEENSANGQVEIAPAVAREIEAAVDAAVAAPAKQPYKRPYKKARSMSWSRKKKHVAQVAGRPVPVREIPGTNSSNLRQLVASYSGTWFTLDELMELNAKHGITIPRGQMHPFLHEEIKKGRMTRRLTDGKAEFTSLIGGGLNKGGATQEAQTEAS